MPRFVPRLVLILALLGALAAPAAQAQTLTVAIPPDPEASRISVVVTPPLSHTSKLPGPALRAARKAMLAEAEVSDADLRALADHADGLAAQRLVQRLTGSGGSASDIAHYATIATATGRVSHLRTAVAAMAQLDPATEPKDRIRAYAAMLYPHAWAGNPLAMDAVIALNGEGRLFGPLSEATHEKILAQAEGAGDGRLILQMAVGLMQSPTAPPEDLARAQQYLARAAASDQLAVRTTALNLSALLEARIAGAMAGISP